MTSEVPTISALINSDSDSCKGEEECKIPTLTEAILALKILEVFVSNSERQGVYLQKLMGHFQISVPFTN